MTAPQVFSYEADSLHLGSVFFNIASSSKYVLIGDLDSQANLRINFLGRKSRPVHGYLSRISCLLTRMANSFSILYKCIPVVNINKLPSKYLALFYLYFHLPSSFKVDSSTLFIHNLVFYPRPVLAFGYCRCLRLSVWASITSLSAR